MVKCQVCGSNFVMENQRAYICSGYVNGRICTNNVRVRRDVLETKLTEKIRTDLLRPEVVDDYRSRLARALRKPNPARGRRQQLEHEVERLVDAIAQGLLSSALSARLQAAEKDLAALGDADKVIDAKEVLALVGPAVEAYRKRIHVLPETIKRTPDVARKVIRDGVGPIVVEPREDADGSRYLVAKMGLVLQPLLAAGGLPIDVVAGAGFGTFRRTVVATELMISNGAAASFSILSARAARRLAASP